MDFSKLLVVFRNCVVNSTYIYFVSNMLYGMLFYEVRKILLYELAAFEI